jgi:hypothetical protein
LEHLPFGFQGVQGRTSALEQGTIAFGEFDFLAKLKRVVVSDDDLRFGQLGNHVLGNELPPIIVTLGIVRYEHPQAIANRDARCNNQKSSRKVTTGGPTDCIDGLPGNDHGHDGCFAGSCGELERDPQQFGIGTEACGFKMVKESLGGSS